MTWKHRMKVIYFNVHASRNQSARWAFWAHRAGFPSIGRWLAKLADREVRRQEIEGGYIRPPPDPNP